MAAPGGHGDSARARDGNRRLGGEWTKRHIELVSDNAGVSDPDVFRLGHDHDVGGCTRLGRVQHDDNHRRRRINNDNAGRRIHDDNFRPSFVRRFRGTGTRPRGADADAGKLDEPGVHDIRGRLEHRLGIPMRSRAGHRSVVRGICDACRSVSRWHPSGQRHRCIRTIGDQSIQSGCADTRGRGAGNLHLGRKGHRLLALPRLPEHGSGAPEPSTHTALPSATDRRLLRIVLRILHSETSQSCIEVVEIVVVAPFRCFAREIGPFRVEVIKRTRVR